MPLWPPWLHLARQEEEAGVVEIPGRKHNERILEYHDTTTLDGETDEIPWCSSFVNWCVKECGMLLEGTNSARARSWLEWGEVLLIPPVGAITILRRGGAGQPGPTVINAKGHVGFLIHQTSTHVTLLGGNQGNRVSTKKYPVGRVLGHRWPL
jgi:uncharacterized protein (TIGR02594 family)